MKKKVYVVSFEWAYDGSHDSWVRPYLDKDKAIEEYNRQLKDLKNEGWEADALKDENCIQEPIYEEDDERCTYAWSERELDSPFKHNSEYTTLASFGIYEYGYESENHSYLRLEEYECEEEENVGT